MVEKLPTQGDPQGPTRILIVDDVSIPHRDLVNLLTRADATVIVGSIVELPLEPCAITPADIAMFIQQDEPVSTKQSFPRNRQGKDYESVFRRPRGRQRR